MSSLPAINVLLPQLLLGTPAEVAQVVGGAIGKSITESDFETCCIRLSRVLNYAGVPVEGFAGLKNRYMDDGKVRAKKGADGKWYIFSTYDLNVYLTAKFGPPKRFKGDATEADVRGVAGVIMFGWRHVDLWDGSKIGRLALFGHASALVNGVLIWPSAA